MSNQDAQVIQFVPRDEWEEAQLRLREMSNEAGQLSVPKGPGVSRKQVVQAFQSAFEMVGGIQRLAIWANDHPTEFYKLYARLLPSQASEALGEKNEMTVVHVIPRGPLDRPNQAGPTERDVTPESD